MAPRARDRLLAAAEDLFYRAGFHAVGVDRIIAETAVTKTTFYNHFESKEALIVEVLEARDQWWRKTFAERLRAHAGDDPARQLHAIFDVLDEFITTDAFNGCMFVNVAVEFLPPHVPAHRAAAEHKELMSAMLRDLALRAGARNPIALAEELALLMEGSYVTRQVTGNRAAAAIGRRIAATLLASELPARHTADDDARTGGGRADASAVPRNRPPAKRRRATVPPSKRRRRID